MKNLKKIFATILMVCMMLSICACGNGNTEGTGSENNKPGSEVDSTVDTGKDSEGTNVDDDKIVYTIKLVDESGAPIADTFVQLCDEKSCYAPVKTDANGVAEYKMAEGEYKAAVTIMPAGYQDVTGEYFYFEGDATEVTITLKKAA